MINWEGKDVEFTGGALRIRRKGVRKLQEFFGHAWQSAVFPSGKAFGYIAYPATSPARNTITTKASFILAKAI